MKSALFAIALLSGTAALAQTDPETTPVPPADPVAMTTAPADTMTQPVSQTVAPSNAAPERDARNIVVISDAAEAPPGFNQPPGLLNGMGGPLADPSQPPAPQPATETYPACSRTVTDNCVQAYERGRRR